ncbi:protein translocase SEC61 complex subunit gamma [Candidatus Pacearchaeota archaeon]|nr:protein translocase SEC61 complex subunit gamma [Candidatus Pacearchaeota archaeon]
MEEEQSIQSKFGSFILQCKRVWHLLRKPTRKEFLLVTKISAIGIFAVGFVGFVISILIKFFI